MESIWQFDGVSRTTQVPCYSSCWRCCVRRSLKDFTTDTRIWTREEEKTRLSEQTSGRKAMVKVEQVRQAALDIPPALSILGMNTRQMCSHGIHVAICSISYRAPTLFGSSKTIEWTTLTGLACPYRHQWFRNRQWPCYLRGLECCSWWNLAHVQAPLQVELANFKDEQRDLRNRPVLSCSIVLARVSYEAVYCVSCMCSEVDRHVLGIIPRNIRTCLSK